MKTDECPRCQGVGKRHFWDGDSNFHVVECEQCFGTGRWVKQSFSDLDIERRNAEDFPSQQKAGKDGLKWPR